MTCKDAPSPPETTLGDCVPLLFWAIEPFFEVVPVTMFGDCSPLVSCFIVVFSEIVSEPLIPNCDCC